MSFNFYHFDKLISLFRSARWVKILLGLVAQLVKHLSRTLLKLWEVSDGSFDKKFTFNYQLSFTGLNELVLVCYETGCKFESWYSVKYISYHMFKEPTITRVPLWFCGYLQGRLDRVMQLNWLQFCTGTQYLNRESWWPDSHSEAVTTTLPSHISLIYFIIIEYFWRPKPGDFFVSVGAAREHMLQAFLLFCYGVPSGRQTRTWTSRE